MSLKKINNMKKKATTHLDKKNNICFTEVNIKTLVDSLNIDSNGLIKEDIKQLISDRINKCINESL